MTIEEAIKHCHDKAKELSDKAYAEWGKSMTEEEAYDCNECAKEHEQLAHWLEELVELHKVRKTGKWKITEAYPHKVYCGECYKTYAQENWEVWKDGSLPRNFCPNCGARMEAENE